MMKRLLSVCCALVLLLGCLGTVNHSHAEGVFPPEVKEYFAAHSLGTAQILSTDYCTGHGKADCFFVVIRTAKGANVLYCFKYQSGKGWVHSFHNQGAVPQGSNAVEAWVVDGSMADPYTDKSYKGPLLCIAQLDSHGEYYEFFSAYQYSSSSGKWNIRRIYSRNGRFANMELNEGAIVYYKDLESCKVAGTVHGTYQRDLRYVSLSSGIPRSLSAARSGLTEAPVLPASAELQAQEINFTGGKKYNVYSAPDKASLRGGNGKALVSTNGWIQVFGREGNWILIQYSIDSGHYRFGYITADSLPKKASVGTLPFQAVPVTLAAATPVTDDPLYSQAVLTTASAGESVTWLATLGQWAYIAGARYRGFVPVSALASAQPRQAQPAAGDHRFHVQRGQDGRDYDLFEITRLHYGADHRVYAVTGRFERMETAGEEPTGVYADAGLQYTFTLSPDFSASMLDSLSDYEMNYVPVTDLYSWYISAYLNGEAPEGGELVFIYDLPQAERDSAEADFWFITTRIELNQRNEIQYMEYVYVPWG